MAVVAGSFAPPGRPPIWEKPVGSGVTLFGDREAFPG